MTDFLDTLAMDAANTIDSGYYKTVSSMKQPRISLKKEIVIPLLNGMGFKDVIDFHGGAGEQGKDIVCWKSDDLDNRTNYAIVLKSKPYEPQRNCTSYGERRSRRHFSFD